MVAIKADTQTLVKKASKAWLDRWNENSENEDPQLLMNDRGKPELRNFNTAVDMLYNYIEERRALLTSKDFKLLEVEKPFAVPIDDSRPDLFYVGRLDKAFEYQGRIYIGEHKTTTSYKKDGPFRSDFVDSFSPNSQVDGYLYASHLIYGNRLKAVWIDAALVHQSVHDGFRFIPVERQLAHLSSWLWETRYWIEQVEANERAIAGRNDPEPLDYLAAFPKNTTSCTNYGGCPYLDICKMVSNPHEQEEFPGYVVKRWEPFDELKFAKSKGLKIKKNFALYDNTRLQGFRTCARAYYFRHYRNIISQGDRRALLFGSSWHEAMDVVWRELAKAA